MFSLPELICLVLFSFVIAHFGYLQFRLQRARRYLKWVPQAPRKPVVGSLLEFGGSTETLKDIQRLSANSDKMFYMEFATEWGVVTYNYDLVKFLLTSNEILDKAWFYSYFYPWLGTGLLTSTGSKWKSRRKIITPAFHFSILERFIETFDSHSNTLISKLKKSGDEGQAVDIYQYVKLYSLDTICETAMGIHIDVQNDKNKDYVFAVQDYCRIAVERSFSSWKGCEPLFRLTQDYRKQQHNLKVLHGFSNGVIEKRRKETPGKNETEIAERDEFGNKKKLNFLDLLLNFRVDGEPLNQEDIREEVDTFIFEGHDTTSSAAASVLYLLAHHPEVQELVRDEQRQIYQQNKNRATTYQDLQEMKYLDSVIKETLRLYPPVPLISRQIKKDISYKDHIIPKSTFVTIFIYGMCHDPQFFENPEEFKPERFLNTSSEYPFSYLPFSAGPRNCIGQRFAVLEIKCLVSKMIRNYQLHPTDPPHKLVLANEAVLKSINGVKIKLQTEICL